MAQESVVVSASHQYESAVFDHPSEKVWAAVRGLAFDRLAPSWVSSVHWPEGDSGKVGATVTMTFRDGPTWEFNVLEISDIKRTIVYELVAADPAASVSGFVNTIRVFKETLSNKTFLTWETDFANDANANVIMDTKYKKLEALNSMAQTLA